MRIKYKDVDIECTVDEFEEMVARGLLGEPPKFDQNDFVKKWNELDQDKERPMESPFDVVMVYGVNLPNGGYQPVWPNKTTTGQKPMWPNKTTTGQNLTYTADNHTGTTIEPTQTDSTNATIQFDGSKEENPIKVNSLDWNDLTKAK